MSAMTLPQERAHYEQVEGSPLRLLLHKCLWWWEQRDANET